MKLAWEIAARLSVIPWKLAYGISWLSGKLFHALTVPRIYCLGKLAQYPVGKVVRRLNWKSS